MLGTASRKDLQHRCFPVEGTALPAKVSGYPQQTLLLWAAVYLAQKTQNSRTKQAAPAHLMQMSLPLVV